jgi:predicted ATP-dependent endonuclease of OLD family
LSRPIWHRQASPVIRKAVASRVGAGTWEALVLAESIVDSEHRLVVLDEPALNLSPTWQHLVRSQLRDAPGQFLLITHSSGLVPVDQPEDLCRLVRFDSAGGATRVRRLSAPLGEEAAARLVQELSQSADARALLFARGAVLVEGETELGALPVWFANHAASTGLPSPASLDLGFYSVGGDTHFKAMLTLLDAFGIPWAIVCDGAAFSLAKGGNHILCQLAGATADPDLRAC